MTCRTVHRDLPRRMQAGFTLIESLVAFLVVAFGMLATVEGPLREVLAGK